MSSISQLESFKRDLEAALRYVGAKGHKFEDKSDPLVKFLSDAFGGALYTWDEYKEGLSHAKHDLVVAWKALAENNTSEADVYLFNALRYIDKCERVLRKYYKETTYGAETVDDMLKLMTVGTCRYI